MLATQKHPAQPARRNLGGAPNKSNDKPFVLSFEVILYRAREPRSLDDLSCNVFATGPSNPYRTHHVCTHPAYSFHCDMLTLSDHTYPLRCHLLAFCFDLKSCVATCFEKKGGGGTPLHGASNLPQLFSDLIADLRSFPNGWSRRPDYDF